jgi:hypothetical protein
MYVTKVIRILKYDKINYIKVKGKVFPSTGLGGP